MEARSEGLEASAASRPGPLQGATAIMSRALLGGMRATAARLTPSSGDHSSVVDAKNISRQSRRRRTLCVAFGRPKRRLIVLPQ
jgi:hypothetical protein